MPQDNHRLGSPTFLCPRLTRLARVVQVPPDPEGSDIPLALWVDVLRAIRGTGISTGCASTTPLGLALAPDLPWEDYPSPGTLGLPAEGFLTPLSLLMPTFSLEPGPRRFTPPLHSRLDAPLPLLLGRSPRLRRLT